MVLLYYISWWIPSKNFDGYVQLVNISFYVWCNKAKHAKGKSFIFLFVSAAAPHDIKWLLNLTTNEPHNPKWIYGHSKLKRVRKENWQAGKMADAKKTGCNLWWKFMSEIQKVELCYFGGVYVCIDGSHAVCRISTNCSFPQINKWDSLMKL